MMSLLALAFAWQSETNELDISGLAGNSGSEDFRKAHYLYSKIAEELIKQTRGDTEARELLEEVLSAAAKAPDTEVKARALPGVAYLYTKVEANRSIAVLGDAVKCINHIDSPDFSTDYGQRKIEGRAFGSYATLQTPGFNPENGFREVGKIDFEGALNLAANFVDKPLRDDYDGAGRMVFAELAAAEKTREG